MATSRRLLNIFLFYTSRQAAKTESQKPEKKLEKESARVNKYERQVKRQLTNNVYDNIYNAERRKLLQARRLAGGTAQDGPKKLKHLQ